MPDTSYPETVAAITATPSTPGWLAVPQQFEQKPHLEPMIERRIEPSWTACLSPMRRFVQLRSRGRVALLPASHQP